MASTYAMVSGGPFGLEEIVGRNGYSRTILILCLTPLVWALPTTLMVSELASAMPETGGFYVWVRRAMGPFWGFQESWLTFLGSVFDMAVYPILFAAYLGHLLPALGVGHWPLALGVGMIAVCVVMNLFGAGFVGRGSIFFVLFLLAPFAFLVWLGMNAPHVAAVHAHVTRSDLMGGILIAMWNYMGWDNASTIAGEVENARKTYTRAMAISLVLVGASYLLPIAAAWHANVPQQAWETGSWVNIAAIFGGQRLAALMTAAGMLAAFSTFNALVMSLSRLPYAMARDGYLPKIFARENSAGAPWVAIVVCSLLWGMAMGLGFERTVILDVLLTGLSILLEFVALIVLRMKEPELPRPFRVPFGGVGLALVSVPPAVLIVISCVRSRSEQIGPVSALMVGVVLIALGVVGYYAGPGRKLPA